MTQIQPQGGQLDMELAMALGFNRGIPPAITGVKTETWRDYNGSWHVEGLPMFHRDLNAMHKVEAEIERRGLIDPYIYTLIAITCGWTRHAEWEVAHATAEQKARAALAVLAHEVK